MESSNKKIPCNTTKNVLKNVDKAKNNLKITDETKGAIKKAEKIFPHPLVNRSRFKMSRFYANDTSSNITGNINTNVRDDVNNLEFENSVDGDDTIPKSTGNTSKGARDRMFTSLRSSNCLDSETLR